MYELQFTWLISTLHSVTDGTQTIHRCFIQQLPHSKGTPFTHSLSEVVGLNSRVFRSVPESKTHTNTIEILPSIPWTEGTCNPRTDVKPSIPHTPTDMLHFGVYRRRY